MKSPTFGVVAAMCLLSQSCEAPQRTAKSLPAVNPPVAVITHNSESPVRRVGDLIHLDSHKSVGQAFKFFIDISDVVIPDGMDDSQLKESAAELRRLGYTVVEPSAETQLYEVLDRDVFLASYPGTVRVRLAVASQTEDGVAIDMAGYNVTIKGETPPPDGPNRPDPPRPPDSTFGLAEQVPGWLATVPESARGDRIAIAAQLMKQAELCAKGTFRTIDEVEQSLNANLAAILKDGAAWREFGEKFNTATDALIASGRVKTPQDLGLVYAEIAGAM